MKKKKDRFVVWIWVAPYVKHYLMTNFKVDDPDWEDLVNISSDKGLDLFFRHRLIKPTHRYDKRYDQRGDCKFRTCKVALEISKSDFYQYGWSLSPTDEANLAYLLEVRCRTILMTYLTAAYLVTPILSECIRKFYEVFKYNEDLWPSDSIRRIWSRSDVDKHSLKLDISDKISKIVIDNLYKNGTISQIGKDNYETITI